MALLNETENIEQVEKIICGYFETDIYEVYSRNKKSAVALARHFIIFILNTHYSYSYKKLSIRYDRHFYAIRHSVKKMQYLVKHDKEYKKYYEYFIG
jgi:chromosomal replication initiation ATPase DnaA